MKEVPNPGPWQVQDLAEPSHCPGKEVPSAIQIDVARTLVKLPL